MKYTGITLNNSIVIDQLYSVHYFEYMSDFSFEGESHDFWEFVFVDKGVIDIAADNHSYTLKKDEIIFHKPNEFHNVTGTKNIAPNLIIVSFSTSSPEMDFFQNKILKLNDIEKNLLANIIMEARGFLEQRLDLTYQYELPLKEEETYGSQQLLRLYLEQLLIHLKRRYMNVVPSTILNIKSSPKITKSKNDTEIFQRVLDYMETHLNDHLTIDQICKENLVGRSQLQKIFKEHCGMGIIEHFSFLKIKSAKELIRTGHRNFTQIADIMGYSSIHYFSRQFKKVTGMTPSEYASSIKAISERPGS